MREGEQDWDGAALGRSLQWTRNLVAQLVSEAGVEDVTQDVWLAATQSRGETWPPSRSWLAGTARKLSAKWWRRAGRGPGPSPAHALDVNQVADPLGSDELVERNEEHQRIAQLVLGLEEPMRTTVLLRFQEGMGVKQIAARQEVGEDTVRWRLRRGLELLRLQLGRERGPDWQLGLIPLIGRPPGQHFIETTTPLWANLAIPLGGVLLSMKFIATVLIASALVAGYLTLPKEGTIHDQERGAEMALGSQAGEQAERAPSLVAPTESSRTTVESTRSVRDLGADSSGEASAELTQTCTLIGRVVDDQQQPISGAEIGFDYPDDLASTTSGGDGRFRLTLDSVPEGDAALVVTPDLYHQLAQVDFDFEGSEQNGDSPLALRPGTIDLGTLVLGPAGAVQGRVLDPERRPLLGGRVRVEPADGDHLYVDVVEEDGHFVVGHLAAGTAEIEGLKDNYRITKVEVEIQLLRTVEQDIVMELGPTISGQVVDQAGRGLPGVTAYQFSIGSRDNPVATDSAGKFSLGFTRDRTSRLKFSKPGWETIDPLRNEVRAGTRDLVIVMAPIVEVLFHVVDADDGTPLELYSLEVSLQNGTEGDSNRADWDLSGIDGHDDLTGPHQDFGRELVDAVVVTSVGYRGLYQTIRFDDDAPGGMTIALKPLAHHRGRVTWQGQPVSGARVELAKQRTLYHYEFTEYQGRVSPGPSREERAEQAKEYATSPGGVTGATLHQLDPTERSFQFGMDSGDVIFTDADGMFELEDWSNGGAYRLAVTPPSTLVGAGPAWKETVIMPKGSPMDFGDVELSEPTAVSGWVQSKNQGPLQGHKLYLDGAMPRTATTDAQGFFKFFRVPPGTRELSLDPSDEIEDGWTLDFILEVHEGVDRELVLPLTFPGSR